MHNHDMCAPHRLKLRLPLFPGEMYAWTHHCYVGQDAIALPTLPGSSEPLQSELHFASFLSNCPERQADIDTCAEPFLRKNQLMTPETNVKAWLLDRGFLFQIVDNHVKLRQLPANEDREAFLDQVGSRPCTCMLERHIHMHHQKMSQCFWTHIGT